MRRSFIRKPSIKKRIAARTSVKRKIRNSLGLRAPRGFGWPTNPKKAAYNKIYNRTSIGCAAFFYLLLTIGMLILIVLSKLL